MSRTAFSSAATLSTTIPTLALLAACGGQMTDPAEVGSQQAALSLPGKNHIMPMTTPGQEAGIINKASKTLTYYGGPVVQNVKVVPVYWNSRVQYQTNLNSFYSAVSAGQYMTFLSQYSTSSPRQTIGNGTRGTPYVSGQTSTNVTDAQVQSFLNGLFNSGALPAPSNNNYYPVHFPSGVTITDSSGNKSCVVFCAYHGTYVRNGQDVYYGVLPDLSQSGCNGGCGGSTVLNNTTSVSSHEFAEVITDPAVGLATVYGPPLSWYNATYGEIGDICNGQQASTTLNDGKVYTVQKLWSNKSSTCTTP